jgi:hypothetical protein
VDLSATGSFDEACVFDDGFEHHAAVPVTLSCKATTVPGQRVVAVGTWCDWDVEKGARMEWTEGAPSRGFNPDARISTPAFRRRP